MRRRPRGRYCRWACRGGSRGPTAAPSAETSGAEADAPPETGSARRPTPRPSTPAPTPSPAASGRVGPDAGLRCCCCGPPTRKQAVADRAGLIAAAAALAGRPGREVGLVLATVLVGQTILGWHNDLVDRRARRARTRPPRKPIADGRLDPGTAWFAITVRGPAPGTAVDRQRASPPARLPGLRSCRRARQRHRSAQGSVVGAVGGRPSRCYPAFLSYGGWGGAAVGEPARARDHRPRRAARHRRALPARRCRGLVADNRGRLTYLPLELGLRIGRPAAARALDRLHGRWSWPALAGSTGNRVGLAQ